MNPSFNPFWLQSMPVVGILRGFGREAVEGIVPADKLNPCEIPPLLKGSIAGLYTKISLWQDEPIIHLTPEQFYGSMTVAI